LCSRVPHSQDSGFPCLAVQTSIRKARAWIKSQQKPLAWDPQGVRPLKPAQLVGWISGTSGRCQGCSVAGRMLCSADNARPWTDPCFAICPCRYGNLAAAPSNVFAEPHTGMMNHLCSCCNAIRPIPCHASISPTVRAMRRVVRLAPFS
jgi:hypothetical protein